MGLFSGIFDIFSGGSEATATNTSNTNVTVNPVTQVANVIDLAPVERLVATLSQANLEQVRGLASVIEANTGAQLTSAALGAQSGIEQAAATLKANETTLLLGAAGLVVTIILAMWSKKA